MPKGILTDLKELIEFASKNCEMIFDRTGHIYPMYHTVQEDGQHVIMQALDSNKDINAALMRAAFKIHKVDRYVFMDEAWILYTQKTDVPIDWKHGLENHPDRREVVMFSAENRKGQMQTAKRYILRPDSGGKPILMSLEIDDMKKISQSSGRLVGLLRD